MTNRLVPIFLRSLINQGDFAQQTYDVIFDTLTACDCPGECSLTFVLTEMLKISHSNFNGIGIPNLQIKIILSLQMTLTFDIILTQYRNKRVYHLNDRAKCSVADLFIRVDIQFIDIRLFDIHQT